MNSCSPGSVSPPAAVQGESLGLLSCPANPVAQKQKTFPETVNCSMIDMKC